MVKKIGDKIKSDLKGFEDVFDLMKDRNGPKKEEKEDGDFDILEFLDLEKQRLEKITLFFEKKMPVLLTSNQTQTVITKQIALREKFINELGQIIQKPSSHFQKELSLIFNKAYGITETPD